MIKYIDLRLSYLQSYPNKKKTLLCFFFSHYSFSIMTFFIIATQNDMIL